MAEAHTCTHITKGKDEEGDRTQHLGLALVIYAYKKKRRRHCLVHLLIILIALILGDDFANVMLLFKTMCDFPFAT